MNVCILGDGLTSLSLAKNLINKKINVHIYYRKKNNLSSNRTIGISRDNFEFFKSEIQDIPKKNFWPIKDIEIYSEKLKNDKIINFKANKKDLFFMIKNDELNSIIKKELIKKSFFKYRLIRGNNFYLKLLKENKYDLIINCDSNNPYEKKFF